MIAADAGYIYLRQLGVTPDLVIGDMDSVRERGEQPDIQTGCILEVLPVEKDDTDMLAAIRKGLEQQCDSFHIYGGLGGRLDHTLANIQCLVFLHNQGAKGYLYGKDCCMELLCNGKREYPPDMRGRISVLAWTGEARGVTEKGFHYSLDKAVVTSDFPIGISNEFVGQESSIEVEDGMLLIYTERG